MTKRYSGARLAPRKDQKLHFSGDKKAIEQKCCLTVLKWIKMATKPDRPSYMSLSAENRLFFYVVAPKSNAFLGYHMMFQGNSELPMGNISVGWGF